MSTTPNWRGYFLPAKQSDIGDIATDAIVDKKETEKIKAVTCADCGKSIVKYWHLHTIKGRKTICPNCYSLYVEKQSKTNPIPRDPVNHPAHYTSDPSGVECITITRHRNFNIGNAIKYLWRAGLKGEDTKIEDLKKAIWYINDEIGRIERCSQT